MNTFTLYRDHAPKLVSPDRRAAIVIAVVVVHALLISLLYPKNLHTNQVKAKPSKENTLKVNICSEKPAPKIAKQTPTEPTVEIPTKKLTHQPEPTVTTIPTKKLTPPPEPTVPTKKFAHQPEPVIKIPTKKLTHRLAPTVPTTPPKKLTPLSEPTAPTIPTKGRSTAAANHRTPSPDVPRHRTSQQAGTRKFYGNNFPTQQGALTEADEAYHRKLRDILDFRWKEPPDSLLNGRRPQTTIELEIAADGRVVGAGVVKESGIGPMDESIRRLLKSLDRLPPPPRGAMKIHVNMAIK